MPTRDERRVNRKHVLEALKSETGGSGGSDETAQRVAAYCKDPIDADTVEFGYVGGLTLKRYYIGEGKPNGVERRSLWTEIMSRMDKKAADPGGWDGETDVKSLQMIAENA